MPEYRLSPRAERDLNGIFDYTTAQWGVEQALRYTDHIQFACAELAEAPQRASDCGHIRPGFRRLRVEHHIVYFRQTDYGIAVIRILHERMDAAQRL